MCVCVNCSMCKRSPVRTKSAVVGNPAVEYIVKKSASEASVFALPVECVCARVVLLDDVCVFTEAAVCAVRAKRTHCRQKGSLCA